MMPLARGQVMAGFSEEGAPPPRPAFNVQDDAGLFTRNPEVLRGISDRLRGLEQKHQFRMYVLIESVVIGTSPVDLAAKLQQAWLPDGDGVVLVYEVDTKTFGMGRPYDSGDVTRPGKGTRIPSFVAADAVERIRSQLASTQKDVSSDPAELLDRLTTLFVQEFGTYLDRSTQPTPGDASTTKFFWVGGGVVCVLGGLVWWTARRFRKSEQVQRRVFRFAPVPDEQRLGAPFGAMVSSRPFSSPGPAHRP